MDPAVPAGEPLHCPLCDYDLRALTEPRCPECGYRFTWEELNDPARRLHPYAFEHHPERNAWSFRRTLLGGLRPGRFWRTLFPTQPSRPRRLVLYWVLASLVMLVPLTVQYVRQAVLYQAEALDSRVRLGKMTPQQLNAGYAPWLLPKYGSVKAYHDIEWPLWPSPRAPGETWRRMRHQWQPLWAAVVLVSWPWLSLAALMVFQVSMRRVRLRPIHVLRCVVYAGDAMVWVALAMLLTIGFEMAYDRTFIVRSWRWRAADRFTVWLVLAALVLLTIRLALAYRLYLRFRHAVAAVIAAQVIVWLVLLKFTLDWPFIRLF